MALSLAARLLAQIQTSLPGVQSVSIGRQEDKSTWRVDPVKHQVAAQAVIDAFVTPTPAQLADEDADIELNDRAVRAIVRELYDLVPVYAGKPTLQQFADRIKARYKTLT
jgi:hypothetical protein